MSARPASIPPDVLERGEQALVEVIRAIVVEELHALLPPWPDEQSPEWLTVEKAAERLGCSYDAVRMRISRGRLEARRQGRRLYVSSDSVDRLG